MPRQLRIESPGAIYPVLSRGGRREALFLHKGDYHHFLKTLAQACQKTGFEIHARQWKGMRRGWCVAHGWKKKRIELDPNT